MRGEQAIFNLEIKKKSGLSINPDIHHSKVFSSEFQFSKFSDLHQNVLRASHGNGEGTLNGISCTEA